MGALSPRVSGVGFELDKDSVVSIIINIPQNFTTFTDPNVASTDLGFQNMALIKIERSVAL